MRKRPACPWCLARADVAAAWGLRPWQKGGGTRRASLAMMFKLAQSAEKRWRRLNGHRQITCLLQGDKFVNGIRQAAA